MSFLLNAAVPDVVVRTINPNWEFVLLACDGIWDVLSNEEVLKFVRTRVAQQMPPELVKNNSNENSSTVNCHFFI